MKKWSWGDIAYFIAFYSMLCFLMIYGLSVLKLDGFLNYGIPAALIGIPAVLVYFSAPTIGLVVFPILTFYQLNSILQTIPEKRTYWDIRLVTCLLYDLYILWWYVSGQHWIE